MQPWLVHIICMFLTLLHAGVGMTSPDPSSTITTPDGVVIPLGKGVASATRSSLLYNEYPLINVGFRGLFWLMGSLGFPVI